MPWNGSGVFNRIYSWVADKNAAIDITASRMDTDTDDITAQGFGNCVTRDGQGQPNASLIPLVSATYDLGSNSFQWRNGWFSGNASIGGTLGVTGNVTMAGVAAVHTTIGGWHTDSIFEALCGNAGAAAISGYTNSSTGIAFLARVDSTSAPLMSFNVGGIATVGSITSNGSSTAYNTSSDARLKKNIQNADLSAARAMVMALQVRSWDWIVNEAHEPFGFVAQEEYLAAPFAVTQGDTNPNIIETQWQRDDSKLVPALLLVVQDLATRLEALERA